MRKKTKIGLTIELPTHEQLPPTREEKWQALREKAENLMEMAEVGHNSDYCIRCLNVLYRKLKSMPKQPDYVQELAKRIERVIVEETGNLPKGYK